MSNVILIVVICVIIVIAAIVIGLSIRSRRRKAANHHMGLPELGSLTGSDAHEESVAEMRAAHREQEKPTTDGQ